MVKIVLSIMIFIVSIFAAMQVYGAITNTRHNLSASGPGDVKATSETQICVFCHTPHKASTVDVGGGWRGPLWNHQISSASYTVAIPGTLSAYSQTQLSTPGQPDRASKLCLSCHDGTVAIGLLYNAPGPGGIGGSVAMTTTYMPSGRLTNLGTDISGTHLVSIAYNQSLVDDKNTQNAACVGSFQWKAPNDASWSTSKIRLRNTEALYKSLPGYNGGIGVGRCSKCGVQCSTCHDPHGTTCSNPGVGKCSSLSSTYEKFVVVDYSDTNNLCAFCHSLYTPPQCL